MTTNTLPATIHEIATQMDRLCPSEIDATARDWGHGIESGHVGHEHEEYDTLGWFAEAGNVGHPVFDIHRDDCAELHTRLAALPDGALDGSGHIRNNAAFAGLRIEWRV